MMLLLCLLFSLRVDNIAVLDWSVVFVVVCRNFWMQLSVFMLNPQN